ncbi:hypothetical protein XAP3CFBP6996_007500 [Xanthomonas citri pv. fuscans CFBP 6996]|uniref:Uncharacterized protein n=2 Tax=Xanthomonas citri TaxID=346 RepID=A0AB33CV98_XANCI|nr:hypothetical protein XcvCFBP7111P_17130 [Xanthomonas citri pv. vignicola]PTY32555.1 hypothetical protein XAP3CFBP6996_007500 [Xanthomonas citri pv. fuscans CFBP 6996]QWN18432.1 hypothetical protein DGN02_07525 [Xanthomonas citri]ASK98703.1 hypothetical protein XcvCFBP7112P_07645 [Xanthomonas citri pv. vignicola]ASL02879.1 hypothetical protein XcvCFBP7113P_07465 [Xanthomonas citri pv. vignicola]
MAASPLVTAHHHAAASTVSAINAATNHFQASRARRPQPPRRQERPDAAGASVLRPRPYC